ncbi:hypothetical protein [Peribacillus kribbensis]|uniref:hypothetical protein n=1 Tax=Peribacillus kribbensis TaxID=356658 RepID=UPI00040F00BF|nr:hypothetical protein [Peribacillus kribbensis]
MIFRIFDGLLHPAKLRNELAEAEAVSGLPLRVVLAFISSLFLFSLSGFLGVGSEHLSGKAAVWSPADYEGIKLFFLGGQFLSGLFYALIILYFFGLFFHILFEIDFHKILAVQLIVLVISLAGKAVSTLMGTLGGIPVSASPFSLGVIGHYLTNYEPVLYFLGQISLFQAAAIVFQIYMFRALTQKRTGIITIWVLVLHVLFWIIEAILLSINLAKFL